VASVAGSNCVTLSSVVVVVRRSTSCSACVFVAPFAPVETTAPAFALPLTCGPEAPDLLVWRGDELGSVGCINSSFSDGAEGKRLVRALLLDVRRCTIGGDPLERGEFDGGGVRRCGGASKLMLLDGEFLVLLGGEGKFMAASMLGNPGDSGWRLPFGTCRLVLMRTLRLSGDLSRDEGGLCLPDRFDFLDNCLRWCSEVRGSEGCVNSSLSSAGVSLTFVSPIASRAFIAGLTLITLGSALYG
jgi:hypothetical protein